MTDEMLSAQQSKTKWDQTLFFIQGLQIVIKKK